MFEALAAFCGVELSQQNVRKRYNFLNTYIEQMQYHPKIDQILSKFIFYVKLCAY